MPGSTLPKNITLAPPDVLTDMQRYALDLDVLLRYLTNEEILQADEAPTLISKLAQQYLTDLQPLLESLEQQIQEYSAANPTLSA